MIHQRDTIYGLLILLFIPALHYLVDSVFYAGLWRLKYEYIPMLIIPVACLIALSLTRPTPFFITGICIAFSLTLAISMINDIVWPRHGLRGLDYLLGSFGTSIGAIISLIYHKTKNIISMRTCTFLGFTGALLGFIIFQQAFCNTVIFCGPFSLMHYT
jgi:hypothetical protein